MWRGRERGRAGERERDDMWLKYLTHVNIKKGKGYIGVHCNFFCDFFPKVTFC